MAVARTLSVGTVVLMILATNAVLFRYEPLPGSHIGRALVWDRWRAQICIVVGETKSCASDMLLPGFAESTRAERLHMAGLPETDLLKSLSRASTMMRAAGFSEKEIQSTLFEDIVKTKEP